MKKAFFLLFSLFGLLSNLVAQNNSDFEQEMLMLVNDLRAQNNVAPLALNPNLNTAAERHSQDMATKDYFSHQGQDGSSFVTRIEDAGYEGAARGENIAAGNSSAETTFNQWANSPNHFDNMVNPNVNEMGIGYGYDANSRYQHYWTQVFGYNNTLSIDENTETDKNIVAYPNPTKEDLFITSQNSLDEVQVKLFDVQGKMVFNDQIQRFSTNFKIPLKNLPKGLYYLQIDDFTLEKIIKI